MQRSEIDLLQYSQVSRGDKVWNGAQVAGKEWAIYWSLVRAWVEGKLRFSHMDSRKAGLEILQSVRHGVGFKCQSTTSTESCYILLHCSYLPLFTFAKEWRDILWFDQKSQLFSAELWWSPSRWDTWNVWSSVTGKGDRSSDEEENEICCNGLKHSKAIVPPWIPTSQTYSLYSDFNHCLVAAEQLHLFWRWGPQFLLHFYSLLQMTLWFNSSLIPVWEVENHSCKCWHLCFSTAKPSTRDIIQCSS